MIADLLACAAAALVLVILHPRHDDDVITYAQVLQFWEMSLFPPECDAAHNALFVLDHELCDLTLSARRRRPGDAAFEHE